MSPPRPRPYIELYRGARGLEDSWWSQLFYLGPLEEGTPLWVDACSVARETMQRARRNLDLIIEHLDLHGYLFGRHQDHELIAQTPWTPPPPETPEMLATLAHRVGPIPLSLRAWWEIVGSVTLQGAFPDTWRERQNLPMNDPLMVIPLDYVLSELDEWEQDEERQEPFRAPIAADIYHKANVSGGDAYKIALPDGRADAPLENVVILLPAPPIPHNLPVPVETKETFVAYLRRSFRWAGFPGYVTGGEPIPERDIERLRPLFEQMIGL